MTFGLKHSLSGSHFRAAIHFADLAKEHEAVSPDAVTEPQRSEHRAYVIGCVVSSCAFLEASINELFLEAVDKNPYTLVGLDGHHVAVLAAVWAHIDYSKLLEKFETVVSICGKTPLDRGAEPHQSATVLVKLRNLLIHYKPEWDTDLETHADVEKRLTKKFDLNPLVDRAALWFPHRCLGSGCAFWAVHTAAGLMEEFSQRIGIPSRVPKE